MSDRALTITIWLALVAFAVTLELVARVRRGRRVTANAFITFALRAPAGRLLVGLGWMWLGWHVFAR